MPLAISEPEPSTISYHTAPLSTYVEPHESVIGELPLRLITGLVVSTTVTIRLIDPVFPEVSTLLYVRVYVHGTRIFTEPDVAKRTVQIPITVSV